MKNNSKMKIHHQKECHGIIFKIRHIMVAIINCDDDVFFFLFFCFFVFYEHKFFEDQTRMVMLKIKVFQFTRNFVIYLYVFLLNISLNRLTNVMLIKIFMLIKTFMRIAT